MPKTALLRPSSDRGAADLMTSLAGLLRDWLPRQRWFAGKAGQVDRVVLTDHAQLASGSHEWLLALTQVRSAIGDARYFLPLAMSFEDDEHERTNALAGMAVSKVRQQAKMGMLGDAMADEAFCRALVEAIGNRRVLKADGAEGGRIRFTPTASFAAIVGAALDGDTTLKRLTLSSNSVSLLGDSLFLKAYRRLLPGGDIELEMGRHLTDVVAYANCVPVAGSVEFLADDGRVWTLALLQQQLINQGDAWTLTVGQLARQLEMPPDPAGGVADASAAVERVHVLARRVAELHLALARRSADPAFDPEPVQPADLQRWTQAVRDELAATLALLDSRQAAWADPASTEAQLAAQVSAAREVLFGGIALVQQARVSGLKTRLHGDLHLGQVLVQRDDFFIIDFEGEPNRSVEERRAKHSALRDVAGMLRSFDYARHTALHQVAQSPTDLERLAPAARQWERSVRAAFLGTYREVVLAGGLYADAAAFDDAMPLLDLFELEKALYELRYEIDNRPDWVVVPLAGIAALAGLGAAADRA